jgi:DNA (cytosine-5)-methyltransferase 1
MTHGSLFSGIGGFDLAAEWMGWENKFHCEWNEFGQKVLNYYWPEAESFGDITKTDFKKYNGTIDIISGGFPCQPYSNAGKRKGKEDDRHLWPEMLRAIREISPRWVVGENVLGIVSWNGGMVFEEVQADLEAEGYEVQPYVLPAASTDAPHIRYRVWFVAYSKSYGGDRTSNETSETTERPDGIEAKQFSERSEVWSPPNPNSGRQSIEEYREKKSGWLTEKSVPGDWENFPTQSPVCSGDDGLSSRLDGITFPKWINESIKGGGNAIVPQVAYQIFKAIEQYESNNV